MESAIAIDNKLFNSSLHGDLEGVLDALVKGGRVAMRGPQGATPFIAAAHSGHIDICDLLLANGSDVNEVELETKHTALHNAAGRGQVAVVEALLSWGAIIDIQGHGGGTPLYAACQDGHLACVLALLKEGASVSMPNNAGSLPIHVAAGENWVEIVRTLLDYDCSLDMLNSQTGDTPLMSAANGGADETVTFLLSKGADPDLMRKGQTALVDAIQSLCSSTIDLLAPITQKGLGEALVNLATWKTVLTPAVKELLIRASFDEEALLLGVGAAAKYGATSMLKILTNGWNKDTLPTSEANALLEIALKSDNAETVQVVLAFVSDVSSENLALALTRGRADVVNLFGLGEDERSTEAAKKRLKEAIVNKTASIENRLPKSYMRKARVSGDKTSANFLDFPPNLGIFRPF